MFDAWATTGVALSVIVKLTGAPVQPLKLAVAEMLATISEPVLLGEDVKLMSPEPLDPSPIEVLSLVQLITEPPTLLDHTTETGEPEQTEIGTTVVSTGCAFNVMVKLITALVQLFSVAVTVTTPTMSTPVLFALNVKPARVLVVPDADTPIAPALVTLQL